MNNVWSLEDIWIFRQLMGILGQWSNNTYLKLHQGYLKQLIWNHWHPWNWFQRKYWMHCRCRFLKDISFLFLPVPASFRTCRQGEVFNSLLSHRLNWYRGSSVRYALAAYHKGSLHYSAQRLWNRRVQWFLAAPTQTLACRRVVCAPLTESWETGGCKLLYV